MSEAVGEDAVLDLVRSANAEGEQALAEHDLPAAERAFTSALDHLGQVDGADQAGSELAAAANVGLGRVMLARDDFRAADLRFDQAQRQRPRRPDSFYWAGCAAAHAANYLRAEWLLGTALTLDSRHGNAYLQRAYVRIRLRKAELALSDLLAAAELQVTDENARLLTTALLLGQGEMPADLGGRTGRERRLRRWAEGIAAARRGDWPTAAALLPGDIDELIPLAAVAQALAGRRASATDQLARAATRAPTDHRISHAQALLHLHTLSATQGRSAELPGWRECIGAWVAVRYDEDFWHRWREHAEQRYGAPVPEDAIRAARTALDELIEQRLPADDLVLLLRRERAAAALLARAGGLPNADPAGPRIVCGPLRIAQLGLEHRLSEFLLGLPTTEETEELFQQFSEIGLALARLAAGRPMAAAMAALDLRCASCARTGGRSHPAMISEPLLCEPGCPEFDRRNPAFSAHAGKHDELADVSATLAARTLLGVARADITKLAMDLTDARRCWRGAVTLANRFNRGAEVAHELAEDAIGRANALSKRDDLTAATAVLDAALAVIPTRNATEHDRVSRELGILLNARAVAIYRERAANIERARDDLRRAVALNPDRARPRFNLGLVLREIADRAFHEFDLAEGIRLLSEAVHQLDIGVTLNDTAKFRTELEQARAELKRRLGDYGDQPTDPES